MIWHPSGGENVTDTTDNQKDAPLQKSKGLIKLAVLAVVVVAASALYRQFGDQLSLSYLAEREAQLKQFRDDFRGECVQPGKINLILKTLNFMI